ncbi:hypothetical protein RUND412_011138 [Rhizina undulata]
MAAARQSAISLTPTLQLRLQLHIKPNASKSRIVALADDRIEVAILEAAREGEANKGVVKFISEVLGTRKSDATIVAGLKSRDKVVLIDGFGPATGNSNSKENEKEKGKAKAKAKVKGKVQDAEDQEAKNLIELAREKLLRYYEGS